MPQSKPSRLAIHLRVQWLQMNSRLKKIGIGMLIALDVMVIAILMVSIVSLITTRDSYLKALQSLQDPNPPIIPLSQSLKPQPLALLDQGALMHKTSGGVSYDLYAHIENSNTQWFAQVQFQFRGEGYEGPLMQGFIPPGEDMYLTHLGVALPQGAPPPNFELYEVQFRRTPRYQHDKQLWLNFVTHDLESSQLTPTSPTTHFTMYNKSAAFFPQLPLLVVALAGGRVVGLTTLILSQLAAFEERPVDIHWFEPLTLFSSLRIVPLLNIYERPRLFIPLPQTP